MPKKQPQPLRNDMTTEQYAALGEELERTQRMILAAVADPVVAWRLIDEAVRGPCSPVGPFGPAKPVAAGVAPPPKLVRSYFVTCSSSDPVLRWTPSEREIPEHRRQALDALFRKLLQPTAQELA